VVGHLRRAAAGNDEAATIVQQEYNFTTQKITQSFSNYSAWHQRSKLLPEIVMHMSEDEKNEVARNELAMVGDAIFTDPDDQSAWLYYWWLMGKGKIIPSNDVLAHLTSSSSSFIRL
jgi:geranylgeranyl transferase type-2 subunit alpha